MRMSPPPMLITRMKPVRSPPRKASSSMVLGWGRGRAASLFQTISVGTGARVSSSTRSVPWPRPVSDSEPYSVATKRSASGCSDLNSLAAFSGPMVWELDGPLPIL